MGDALDFFPPLCYCYTESSYRQLFSFFYNVDLQHSTVVMLIYQKLLSVFFVN